MRFRTALLAGLGLAVAGTLPAQANTPAEACANLAATDAPATKIEKASLVTDREDLPDFCQVEGRIEERIGFVMRMPASDWNGKFVVAGCGGFCGYLAPDKPGHSNTLNSALAAGYTAIQTDSGHQAVNTDTDWAIGDPRALELFAGAWMPLAVATGQHITSTYFAREPRRTYFSGCSNGGRLGLYAAQRYPDLFDGIAAGDGVFDLSGYGGIYGLWLLQTTRDRDGRAVIDQAKVPLLSRHVKQRCDALDGVEDGIVSRPQQCEPDVAALRCRAGETAECLTDAEVSAIERLYRGANANGEQLFPGVAPGSEDYWTVWLVGTDDDRAWGERASEGYLRLAYGIPSSEPFRPHDYALADEIDNIRALSPLLDATNPDLGGLNAAGTRLFYYHGLADPMMLPERFFDYVEQARQVTGESSLAETTRFVTVPGFGHCWERTGLTADEFDPLDIIDRWVEQGEAPDRIRALQRDADGEVQRSRPLCALPARAVYQGGDTSRAENFACETP
ncbi:tannase/feruloyl esterase family alpha/beta hydrolase [Parahaliea mediterranea]|uniref:Tannase/feruloyl esterase family alpha/beta hydrolase n=1 Tax=Parahaliea mediterranea TaxID=651086 RepID=A0A939INK3_9GAMM|nr:tannase/feruloyl esterase family alpha/beta hydrolase [Parahaliea mediterranea]MBN7798213.1 tannase/feruloyl esterase family alpha/beta hydrolase [Parahaliea mediterranea]